MPPNVLHHWDSDATRRRYRDLPTNDNNIDEDFYHPEFDASNFFLPSKATPLEAKELSDRDRVRAMWKNMVRSDASATTVPNGHETIHVEELLSDSLSSIIVLRDEKEHSEWLEQFGGQLSGVSSELCQELRKHAPDLYNMSTVADFNDNLCYHVQREKGPEHPAPRTNRAIEEALETTLEVAEYLGSFLATKSTIPQLAHVDYPWEVLEKHGDGDHQSPGHLKLGFFPLTEEGMFLQVWPTACPLQDRSIEIEGQLVFIPYGKMLVLPASTIHGGGFRTTPFESEYSTLGSRSSGFNCGGNLRFHLYIATDDASLPAHQTNKYTERCDKTKELSRRYVDSRHMSVLLDHFFVST